MSAFVVTDQCINEIVSYLWAQPKYTQFLQSNGYDLRASDELNTLAGSGFARLATRMFVLNVKAVDQRDGKGGAKKFRDLNFIPVTILGTTLEQAHDQLGCWLYQCSEGNIPDRPLFKLMGTIHDQLTEDKKLADQKRRAEIRAKTTEYDVKETAVIIRRLLKEKFPTTKFSVRLERFSGGNSVNMRWTDGPTEKQVRELVGHMKMGSFNGMIDLYEYSAPQPQADGTYVRYNAKYLGYYREFSLERYTKLRDAVCEEWQLNPEDFPIKMSGDSPYVERDWTHEIKKRSGFDMQDLIHQKSVNTSFESESESKPTTPEKPVNENGVQFGEYKGHPTITLPMENGKGFTFGLSKAQAILDNIEVIEQWMKDNEQ